nr:MAG TPA: hypothetical protein [Caudoviricetes sp.]
MLGLRTVTGSLVIASQKNKNNTLIQKLCEGLQKNELCKTKKIVLPLTTQFKLYINYKK